MWRGDIIDCVYTWRGFVLCQLGRPEYAANDGHCTVQIVTSPMTVDMGSLVFGLALTVFSFYT